MSDGLVPTVAGVDVAAAALETAAELTALVREATRELPFDVDPASFLVALESLARDEGRAGE
ncbi:MAG: hypothetical protein U1E52_19700 [Geminicoccaceae bacterium]